MNEDIFVYAIFCASLAISSLQEIRMSFCVYAFFQNFWQDFQYRKMNIFCIALINGTLRKKLIYSTITNTNLALIACFIRTINFGDILFSPILSLLIVLEAMINISMNNLHFLGCQIRLNPSKRIFLVIVWLAKSMFYICLLTIHLGIMHTIILASYDSASVIGLHKWHTSFLQLFSQTWSNHIRRHSDILALKHIVDNNVSHLTVRHDTHRLIPTRENHLPLACQLPLYDTCLPFYFTHCILGFICLVATGQFALWHLNLYGYDVRAILRLAKLVV